MRQSLAPEQQNRASQGIFELLKDFVPYRNARCIMAYVACRGEMSLAPVIGDILASGRVLALPRCEAPGVMTARRVKALSELKAGAFGLMEPDEACEILAPQEIDLILLPGTAFDRKGNRLGQGGGYYDRFLPKTKALRIGVCHKQALLECVPGDAHDMRMDAVITPEKIICVSDHRRNGHG